MINHSGNLNLSGSNISSILHDRKNFAKYAFRPTYTCFKVDPYSCRQIYIDQCGALPTGKCFEMNDT